MAEPAPTTAAAAAEMEALDFEPAPEAEAIEDAPSVPAAFDDALTQAEPFAFETPEPEAPELVRAVPAPAGAAVSAAASPVAEMIATVEAALGETVVPRIAIHVFAQTAETAAIAQTAAADRRLARASTAVRPGGLPEALALYATSPTPALVIVENTAPAMQLLADLERLAEVCDPGTKVVVIGEANDIGLYRELIRRGVSEYLVPPLSPLQLIRTIGGLYADPATPFVGRTIAFVGAKGGVGASTLAHNFAWCLSERIEVQACVVDYDLPFGTAGLDFNQDPVQSLHDALDKPERLDETLIERMLARCTERLSLFAAPATLDDDYDIAAEAYEEVAAKIRSTAPFMVLDLPHVWSGWMRKTLLSADEVVLVAQPDLASLRNAKNLLELVAKARPNDAPPRLVLNQVGLPGRPEIPLKDFGKALGVEPELVIPFDAKLFGLAANNGQMIGEVNPKAKPSEALVQFAQTITRRTPVAAKPKSLVERLLKGG
ncbi:MAG: AAA family ATPase [Caulobacteraceae bacterium]|nr:AAA family ATPase [Caulobacter sp.]